MESPSHMKTSVVIVGGGLSGLTAAVALAIRKIPTILVERRREPLQHPRADGLTPRTVEIFRSLDLSAEHLEESPPGFKLRRARVESLTGTWFEELAWNADDKPDATPAKKECSPYRGATTPQDVLEPILLEKAVRLGVQVKFGHEFTGLAENEDNITCAIKDETGAAYQIRSQYLIGADGHRSAVRETLEIARTGHGHVSSITSVLFRAPNLEAYFQKGITQFTIDQPDLKAFLIAYKDRRLSLHLPRHKEPSEEAMYALVCRALGTSDTQVDVLGTSQWDMSALIAENFSKGRVYLIGDSAHSLPPNRGGYGVNTGIADAHNLSWKLAHVLNGVSDPKLLATYEAERLPVAWLRHNQIFARADYKTLQKEKGDANAVFQALDDDAVEFGELYCSSGIIGADMSLPAAQSPDKWCGQPGTRAPHVYVECDGVRVSTLSLFGKDWILLSVSTLWENILAKTMENSLAPVMFVRGQESLGEERKFVDAYGLSDQGCSLVRPDGYIAWRSVTLPGKPAETLSNVLRSIFFF